MNRPLEIAEREIYLLDHTLERLEHILKILGHKHIKRRALEVEYRRLKANYVTARKYLRDRRKQEKPRVRVQAQSRRIVD